MRLTRTTKARIEEQWDGVTEAREFAREFAQRHGSNAAAVEEYLRSLFTYSSVSQRPTRTKLKRWTPRRWINSRLAPGHFVLSDTMRAPAGFAPPAYRFILGVSDWFTKRIFLEPLTQLTAINAATAMERVMKRAPFRFRTLLTDNGTVSPKQME